MSSGSGGGGEPIGAVTSPAVPAPVIGPSVAVVGSLNLDLVVAVPHHPRPGETVLGGAHTRHPGGKGANQAVAAARLGQRVAMIGRVGDDDSGRWLTSVLADAAVDATGVHATPDTPTGVAFITVDPTGENAIVVSPGANAVLSADDVDASVDVLTDAGVTLLQLEVPLEAVQAAARTATGTVVLNPAPGRQLPPGLLADVDILVPNETELGLLVGEPTPDDADAIVRLARRLDGPEVVIVTLGSRGALLIDAASSHHMPAVPVDPVDTTAAGDAFCGALADALIRGQALESAVRWANRAAAVTVTRRGAQPALPTRDEVEELS